MGNKVFAVLLDTVSIQRYIFSTNNLKENIGASYLVEDIYNSHLKKVITEMFSLTNDDYYEAWEKQPYKIAILEDSSIFEIGYIGGGNALLFFKEENKAREFIKKWTMRLLIYCPGLIPACAIGEIEFNNKFKESINNLFKTLAKNKMSFVPQTIIRRHGITAECSRTGYSREIWCDKLPSDEQNYISSVSNAKIFAAEKADKKMEKILEELNLSHKYTFTNQLDKLGQRKGEESHIAIVHIDGNDTGSRVKSQNDLVSLRKFSKTLKEATYNAFKAMLTAIDKNVDNIKNEGINLENQGGKTILPLRPIIIGGDDITFVSEGRLGIWLAKIFLEEFQKQSVSDGKPISASAGVAITKTKYPFYRGYQLSEELTRSAKDRRKMKGDNGSWIDFHIVYGGFSGDLEDIRETHYKAPSVKSLVLRPYKIEDFNELLKGVKKLKESFPRSKIMKLREVLYREGAEYKLFMEELKVRGLKLPAYKNFNGNELVQNMETPYFDMIELTEFYPEFALEGGGH